MNEARPEWRLPTPPEDPDVVLGKQVILRPRPNGDAVDTDPRRAALPPMGGAPSSPRSIGSVDPVVYYYDQRALQSPPATATATGPTRPSWPSPRLFMTPPAAPSGWSRSTPGAGTRCSSRSGPGPSGNRTSRGVTAGGLRCGPGSEWDGLVKNMLFEID